ncbi:hypothetical protein FRC04_001582 [Tulasnella sp. 424]|nr:hypothetical protein FRC04_001582 [Tulasnella sp. 424]KAG8968631.1 hypothetical protein FRC05_001483 [Tulasnella sp. 425]
MNSRKMHPTSPLKHPPPTQPYPYHHNRYSLSSLNTLILDDHDDADIPENDSQLTHLPITSFTVADPQALISRMATAGPGPSSASAASRSPASSRTKTKMLDKFGSLGKKVVKEVLGGTGNNPPQNRGDAIPTFGRGGVARPKVRVYGATPMPLTATKSLGVVGAFDSPADSSSSIAVQVDTVRSAAAGSSASSGILPTLRSSPHPSATTTNTTTDASFHFAAPSPLHDVPYNNGGSKVRPHSDHPFARGGAAFPDPDKRGAGRLDDEDAPGDSPLPSVPPSHQYTHQAQIRPARTRTDFISMFTSSRSPSRERSLSPPPPPVPPLPLETKPKMRSLSHPPPIAHLIRDDFEFLNYPPDQLQDLASGGGSGSASRRSSRRLGRRISVATSTGSYTTARSKSRPRTTITTTTRSFNRRPPPLHLELSADQVYYPRPQLPEQRAYGSGLLDRDEEESMVIRYDTPAGIVSEWRDEDDERVARGGEGERTRRGKMYRLSSPMEFPPTPSSGSFDLGSRSNTATATGGRSMRTITPGFSFAAPSEAATAGHTDERGRSRMRGPRERLASVAGSLQETFGGPGTPNFPLPAPEESGVLPDQPYVGERDGEVGQQPMRRRPLPSPPTRGLGLPPHSIAPARYVSLPAHQNTSNNNSSSGSLPSLSLPLHHHHPYHHHQLGTSASHASTHSRSSLGGFSETHSHSDAASSSIASANALLIQNALKLLAGGAPSGPPPMPPTVAVPGLHQHASSSTSVLGLGLPISPFILPQPTSVSHPPPPPPNLAYGPLSPLMGGGVGAGVSSLPTIPGVPSLLFPSQPQPFSPQLGGGLAMPGLVPFSSPQVQQAPLGLGSPQMMMGGQQQQQFPQAMELLIALANQNLRLMAAVEQQRQEQQQQQQQQQEQQNVGGGVDMRRERSTPPAPSAPGVVPGEALGLQTGNNTTGHLQPSPSPSDRRRTRTSLLSTSTAPSNFTAASNSSSSNSSQSKRASVAHSQQTPTPPVSPRPSSSNGFPASSTPGTARTRTPSSPAISPRPPSFKRRISTPKLGRPFRISLSTVLGGGSGTGGGSGDGASTRGLATPVEEVPPPVPPLPASLVAATKSRAQPQVAGTGTVIDTRPSTALSDYEADDDEERKRERPHSWLAEVRGWEELVLGDLSERQEPFSPSSSSAARAMAEMGELKSPGLFSVSTGTTAAETSFSGSTRKNTFDEERGNSNGSGDGFAKVPFPRSRSRPREMGFASAGYAMRTRSGARTLSSLSRVGLEIFERDGRVRDSIDSMDSVDSMDSTASSNGGAMDLEELSIMTAHVFS